MLLGNKLDIVLQKKNSREITREQAQKFADDNNLLFEEISALNDVKILESFEKLFECFFNPNISKNLY